MNELDTLAKRLESLLLEECKLYQAYMEVVGKEEKALLGRKISQMEEFTEKRAFLYERMLEAQDQRLEMMREHPGRPNQTMRQWIIEKFPPVHIKKLIPIANQLHALVKQTRSNSRQYRQIINFAHKIINGVFSHVHSATSNVLSSYNKKGREESKSNPQDRQTGVLKQA